MSRDQVVLVLDDKKRWRDELTSALANANYKTFTASNKDEALQIIHDRLIHVASIDIEMVDEPTRDTNLSTTHSPINTQGLELVRQLQAEKLIQQDGHQDLKFVVVSAHGAEFMREAFRDLDVSDVIDKSEFHPSDYLQAVAKAFDSLNINFDLNISWRQGQSPKELILGKKYKGEEITDNEEQEALRSAFIIDVDDLLCRLFAGYRSVLLDPFPEGFSNALVFKAEPLTEEHASNSVVIKIDSFGEVNIEYQNYIKYVAPLVTTTTNVVAFRRTARLGGITYSFVGQYGKRLINFAEYFRENDAASNKDLLTGVFSSTCGKWYAHKQASHTNLTEIYEQTCHFTYEKLQKGRDDLNGIQGEKEWVFQALTGQERRFATVLPIFERRQTFNELTYECVTHGDLNAQNILIDDKGSAWLIDFRMTGVSHILRDIVFLDSIIRIQLTDASLSERFRMEETLLNADKYADLHNLPLTLDVENESVQKAFGASVTLRKLAGNLVSAINPDMREYNIANFYTSFNQIRYQDLTDTMREHGALAACLIRERYSL